MPAFGGLLLCERGASQLLGWREGFEQRSDNFSAEKFSELVPRPIGLDGVQLSRRRNLPLRQNNISAGGQGRGGGIHAELLFWRGGLEI